MSDEIKAADLNPCPFCGSAADLLGLSYHGPADCSDVHVSCNECGAIGPTFVVDHSEGQDEDGAANEAVNAWNRRSSPQEAGEPVAWRELRDAVDFFDRVKVASEEDRIAVGHDHWDRLEAAARAAALTSPPDPQARIAALEKERDAWKVTAEHHFAHMRAALDLSYHLRYPPCPMLLDQVADLIDCGDGCENAWREHDTNATGCTRSEGAEGCPFEMATELRDFAKALRVQAWTLAFAPPPTDQAATKGADHVG